jgi:threonine dehydrogenase-like Zn-dependent dehydrogenase
VLEGCNMVRRMGEVVLVGVPWRKYTDLTAHDITNAVFFKHVTLRSGWEWELPMHGRSFLWEELLEGYNNAPHSIFSGFSRALTWLAQDRIPLDGLIHRTTPGAPELLYAGIMQRDIAEPFIVLDWGA